MPSQRPFELCELLHHSVTEIFISSKEKAALLAKQYLLSSQQNT